MQKQQRMLNCCFEIVVVILGWLWELIKEKYYYLRNFWQFRCLVVDEVDWMVEKGYFVEFLQLLEMFNDF